MQRPARNLFSVSFSIKTSMDRFLTTDAVHERPATLCLQSKIYGLIVSVSRNGWVVWPTSEDVSVGLEMKSSSKI